jgi:hypothetical protein
MAYPTLRPSSRDYAPGDWANKRFSATSGAEIRMRYGDRRFGATLNLSYSNVPDADAQTFLTHYDSTYGTYGTFSLPAEVLAGWKGGNYTAAPDMRFRYEGPPEVKAVRPGISSVSVTLVGVV